MTREQSWQMKCGAQPDAGGASFRVWAPGSVRVDVVAYGPSDERVQPMSAEGDGYFHAFLPDAGPGTRYRYRLGDGSAYPDPASRFQPEGVHGPSEVVDPNAFAWSDDGWGGTPHEELVVYEMHVGTFSADGTFDGAIAKLDHVADLGVTAIEVMPVANFPGGRNWGYDGVNLFAPATAYGGVDGFKRLVDAAHARGLAVLLDVVYNHLGPEGNYIPAVTGGRYFTDRHKTPWGDGINFDGPDSRPVRDFVLDNALYWLLEYHIDGLRLDATHAIVDDSERHILAELVDRVDALPGRPRLLIAEDERHERRLLLPRKEGGYGLDAVWADDLHHQIRRRVAGDTEGYFAAHAGTTDEIAETLRSGWGRRRPAVKDGGADGGAAEYDAAAGPQVAEDIDLKRFVQCIQNHDQVGNRALGERLNHQIGPDVFRAISALILTTPGTPLVWMGQEWAASSPFLYFTDHPEELGRLVTAGRREEFGRFSAFRDAAVRERIPDPQSPATFEASKLVWAERDRPPHAGTLTLYRTLLHLRREHGAFRADARYVIETTALGEAAIAMRRRATPPDDEDNDSEAELLVLVNLEGEIRIQFGDHPVTRPPEGRLWSHMLATEEARFGGTGSWGRMEPDGILHLMGPGAIVLEPR
ncbi:MAG: malto-oligosyltrehalose trehalohydrolase [Gemmatimonadota bacterium]